MKKLFKTLAIYLGIILGTASVAFGATILFPVGGGLGTGTAPTYGQVPVGTVGGVFRPPPLRSPSSSTLRPQRHLLDSNLLCLQAPMARFSPFQGQILYG